MPPFMRMAGRVMSRFLNGFLISIFNESLLGICRFTASLVICDREIFNEESTGVCPYEATLKS
jgi:hypothetical protein